MQGLNEQISEPSTLHSNSTSMVSTETLRPGALLRGHSYQIQKIIGRGSFGITYAANHTSLGNTVAIKEYFPSQYVTRVEGYKVTVSSPEYELAYKHGLQQFIQEGQILASINHPNIVQVRDLFEEGQTAYLVMELVQGNSLHRELELQVNFKLPIARVTIIVEQMVSALKKLHELGVYHLDIKPQNILLTAEDKAILIDFGAARGGVTVNQLTARSFTEAYAPPELTTGGKLGAYSDIFELGMLLHQMLTGTLPPHAYRRLFEGEVWEPVGLEEPWSALIKTALILDPLERPQTIQEWWDHSKIVTAKVPEETNTPDLLITGNVPRVFTLPLLQNSGMQHRLGRGCLRKIFSVGTEHILICAASGITLMGLPSEEIVWEIDSPTEQASFNEKENLLALVWQQNIYLWNIKTGQLVQVLQGHTRHILAIALSPNSSILVSSSVDESIFIWDLTKMSEKRVLSLDYALITCLAFSPDGRYLALGTSEGNIKLLLMETLEVLLELKGHYKSILSLAFSCNGAILASGGKDNLIYLWKMPTGEQINALHGHTDWVTCLAFSPKDQYLASGGGIEDKSIILWSLQKEVKSEKLEQYSNSISSLAFLGEQLISTTYDQTINIASINSSEVNHLKQHSNWIYDVAFSPNHSYIVSGHNDGTLRLWSQEQEDEVLVLTGHKSAVSAVAFHRDGFLIASGSWDQTVCLWDATNGQLIRTFKGHQDWVKALAFSPDGSILATASRDATVRLWNVSTPSNWLKRTKQSIRTFKGHLEGVSCIVFSPNGQLLASGGYDQTIRLWEVISGQEVTTLEGHSHHINSLAFTPDGRFLLSASTDKTIRLWSVSGGEIVQIFRGHLRSVTSIAISPDGEWFVSGSADRQVRLWSLPSQKAVKLLLGHTNTVNSVDFAPDNKTIVSADHDGVIRVWQF